MELTYEGTKGSGLGGLITAIYGLVDPKTFDGNECYGCLVGQVFCTLGMSRVRLEESLTLHGDNVCQEVSTHFNVPLHLVEDIFLGVVSCGNDLNEALLIAEEIIDRERRDA